MKFRIETNGDAQTTMRLVPENQAEIQQVVWLDHCLTAQRIPSTLHVDDGIQFHLQH
jgi:hypothetical protein